MKNTLSISFSIIGIGGLISAILFSFSACNHAANNFASHDNNNVSIIIQPYNDMPKEYTQFVYSELGKVYSNLKINKPIAMPHTTWYEPKARYRADSLIRILSRSAGDNTVIIGLTTKDISHTNSNIVDYGIMGLGFCPGKACIVSTFRLRKKNVKVQLYKIAIHELGHTQGLPHCADTTCYMRDAEGKNHTQYLNAFCVSCKHKLENRGWHF
ncbi:MAG: Zn-dependent protease [Bacteroidetes bacterium]|nr:Zn-dependent protease [Bacteroidota bacterium]MBL0050514.1 Zn-dependent protease [Bacteroidota bacterium]